MKINMKILKYNNKGRVVGKGVEWLMEGQTGTA